MSHSEHTDPVQDVSVPLGAAEEQISAAPPSIGGQDDPGTPSSVVAAGGAPSSRAGKGYFLTEEQIQHLLDASVRSAIQAHISLSPGPSSTSSSRIHKKDLPEFKGYSPDGADAVSFLDTLETSFTLHKIHETEQTKYASLSFPINTPAHSWYREQRDSGQFRLRTDPPDVLRFSLFKQLFQERFSTPTARRYALEDTWDRFTQKGTLADHYVKFTQLLHRLQQLKIFHPLDVIASKFLRSLKKDIFDLVCNKNRDLPTLEELHRQAVEAEYQLKPTPGQQQLRGTFPNNPLRKGNPKSNNNNNNKNKDKSVQGNKWCDLHKWNPSHTSADCRGIKRMKEKGT